MIMQEYDRTNIIEHEYDEPRVFSKLILVFMVSILRKGFKMRKSHNLNWWAKFGDFWKIIPIFSVHHFFGHRRNINQRLIL